MKEKTKSHKLPARGTSAKIAVNRILTHAHTNQRRTLDQGCSNP